MTTELADHELPELLASAAHPLVLAAALMVARGHQPAHAARRFGLTAAEAEPLTDEAFVSACVARMTS